MRPSVNVRAFAASEPHCKSAAPYPECKCSCVNAPSRHFYHQGLENQSKCMGQLSSQWPACQCYFRDRCCRAPERSCREPLCRQWQVHLGSIRAGLILALTWPFQLGQSICLVTCLGPRHSSPTRKPNVKSLLCNVKNKRLRD